MLDPKLIRQNPQKVKQNIEERTLNPDVVDIWLEIDSKRTELLKSIESLNRERNSIAELLKESSKRNEELINKGKNLKSQLAKLEDEFKAFDSKWYDLLMQIPNLHFDDVPKGKNDGDNAILKTWGNPTQFDFEPKDHLQIGTDLDFIDFENGAKVTGSQFYYLKNDLVRLVYGLINYGFNLLEKKGFTLIQTPDLAKSRYYLGTGYVPKGDEAQTYTIEDEDLGLIATAEITMAGYHADEIIDESNLPMKYAAISHCFRKEAGAYGKYSKGLYRVHQFTKLEMFAYSKPEDSPKIHQEFLSIEEEILQSLKIPYRIVEMCTGDLGFMAAKKFDLEAWMPGRNDYGEVTSTSNCTDYQSRNLNIRYRKQNGEIDFLHMLNGTALVLSRHIIAIMENYQQKDGSIKVPDVLVPYVGKEYLGKKSTS